MFIVKVSYCSPTAYRGARWRASLHGYKPRFYPRNDALDARDDAIRVALEYLHGLAVQVGIVAVAPLDADTYGVVVEVS